MLPLTSFLDWTAERKTFNITGQHFCSKDLVVALCSGSDVIIVYSFLSEKHEAVRLSVCADLSRGRRRKLLQFWLNIKALSSTKINEPTTQTVYLQRILYTGSSGRKIAPNTGTNATKFFTLATKSWKLVAKLATRIANHTLPRDLVIVEDL